MNVDVLCSAMSLPPTSSKKRTTLDLARAESGGEGVKRRKHQSTSAASIVRHSTPGPTAPAPLSLLSATTPALVTSSSPSSSSSSSLSPFIPSMVSSCFARQLAWAGAVDRARGAPAEVELSVPLALLSRVVFGALVHSPLGTAATEDVCALAKALIARNDAVAGTTDAQRRLSRLEALPDAVLGEIYAYVNTYDMFEAVCRTSRRLRLRVFTPGGVTTLNFCVYGAPIERDVARPLFELGMARALDAVPAERWSALTALCVYGMCRQRAPLRAAFAGALGALGPRLRVLHMREISTDKVGLRHVAAAVWSTLRELYVKFIEGVDESDSDSDSDDDSNSDGDRADESDECGGGGGDDEDGGGGGGDAGECGQGAAEDAKGEARKKCEVRKRGEAITAAGLGAWTPAPLSFGGLERLALSLYMRARVFDSVVSLPLYTRCGRFLAAAVPGRLRALTLDLYFWQALPSNRDTKLLDVSRAVEAHAPFLESFHLQLGNYRGTLHKTVTMRTMEVVVLPPFANAHTLVFGAAYAARFVLAPAPHPNLSSLRFQRLARLDIGDAGDAAVAAGSGGGSSSSSSSSSSSCDSRNGVDGVVRSGWRAPALRTLQTSRPSTTRARRALMASGGCGPLSDLCLYECDVQKEADRYAPRAVNDRELRLADIRAAVEFAAAIAQPSVRRLQFDFGGHFLALSAKALAKAPQAADGRDEGVNAFVAALLVWPRLEDLWIGSRCLPRLRWWSKRPLSPSLRSICVYERLSKRPHALPVRVKWVAAHTELFDTGVPRTDSGDCAGQWPPTCDLRSHAPHCHS